jgi:hypothetical protein
MHKGYRVLSMGLQMPLAFNAEQLTEWIVAPRVTFPVLPGISRRAYCPSATIRVFARSFLYSTRYVYLVGGERGGCGESGCRCARSQGQETFPEAPGA